MKCILGAVGLFCLMNVTNAQTLMSMTGLFQPANTGSNGQNSGVWTLEGAATNRFDYGGPGDIPVVGFWYGRQGFSDIGVFRPAGSPLNNSSSAEWLLRNIEWFGPPNLKINYGGFGDIPVVGDWTGSGITTIGVYRPPGSIYNPTTEGQWLLRNSNKPGPPDLQISYGGFGDIPVVGDWTGSGITTIGVYRPPRSANNPTTEGQWLLRNSNKPGLPDLQISYGGAGDIPVVGDWTGLTGTTTIGVYRPPGSIYNPTTHGQWLLRNSNKPGRPDLTFSDLFSEAGSIPVVGSWQDFLK